SNYLQDVDATDITNYEAHRYPRTLKSKHPPCRMNQYFDVDKRNCMGVIGGGKALYVNNKISCGSNVLKSHCTNPRYYYICRQNKTILAQCPQNRHFESHLQKCILVPRDKHISATNGQNSDIFDSVQHLDCLKTGSFPVPDNCGLFYTCSMHGKKMNKNFYTCPKNMAYDTETEMCKPSSTCREPESLASCRDHPWDGKKENVALKEAVFPTKGRSETCETIFTNEEDTTTNSTSDSDDEIKLITTSYTEPFVSELTRSGDSNDIVTTTERALEKSRFTNNGDFAIPITATYSTIAVENTYPTEFNLPVDVNGNKELGSRTVAEPFENDHTRIITDDPKEQSPDDQDRTGPTILDDPSTLENIERENIPDSENPSLGKQYNTTEEFNEEPMFGIRNIDTEPITLADPTSPRNNEPTTNLDTNKTPLEIPIDDPRLQNQHSTTKAFNEESISGAENTLPTIIEDVTAPSPVQPEEPPIAEIIPTESPVQIPTEEPNLENQHSIQEESSEKPVTENESMNIAPTISEDPTILNNVEAKELPVTAIIPLQPSVQIPISEDPNLTDQYKAPENLSEESTTETENINTDEIIVGDPTTLINTEPEEEPVTEVISDESPVVNPTTENPELPIPEIENINTEPTILPDPTTLINTEPEEEGVTEVISDESPVVNPTTENPELPIPEIENINTEPTILSDPTTLINTKSEEEPAKEVVLNESPDVIPTTENPELPIPEIENINTEPTILPDPTTLINTEPEEEPATKVISDESPVGIPTTENPELSIPEIENINTEPTILPDPTTLINTEPEKERVTGVTSDESPVGIPTTENPELPIPEIENINTEPTILPDPTTLINTEPEKERVTEVISDESPVVNPTTENPELPIPEIENINTEPTILPDPTTFINTEPEEEPATKVISDESPVGIPTTENPELSIPEIENINTEPTILPDPTTLINTEPEKERVTGVTSDESPVGIPTTENPELPIPEIENINTEPTILPDPTTLINTEPEKERVTEVISDESPVVNPTTENPELPIPEIENINTEPTILPDPTTLINIESEEEPAKEVVLNESPDVIPTTENPELPIPEIENINTEPTILPDPTTLINTEPEEEPATKVISDESPVGIPTTENPELSIPEIENINTEPTILPDPTTLINTEPEKERVTGVTSDESPVGIPTTENPELPIPEIENINTEPTILPDPTTLINTEPEEERVTEVISDESPVVNPTTENPELPIPEIENINTEPTILPDPTTLINTEPEKERVTGVTSDESPVGIPTTENPELPIPEIENINTEPTILPDPTTLINTEPEKERVTGVTSDESPVGIPTTENPELPIPEIENINTEPTILSDPTTLINIESEEEPAKEVVLNESPDVIPTTENPELPIPEIENINTEPTILPDPTTLINTEPEEEPATKVISDESPVGIPTTENPELSIPEIENINTEPTILPDPTTFINTEPEEEPATKVISDESPVVNPTTENPELPIPEIENINTEPTILPDPTTFINTEPEEEPVTKVISDEPLVVNPTTENPELPIPEIGNINTEPTILPDPTTFINTEPEEERVTEVISDESPVVNPTTENPELPIPDIENINTEPTILPDPTTFINTEPEEERVTEVISDESLVVNPTTENPELPVTEIENINTEPTILSNPKPLINTESEEEPEKEVVLNESPVVIASTENPELPIPEIENINTEPSVLMDSTTLIDTEPDEVTELILDKSSVGTSATENPSLEKEYNNILTNSIAPDTTKPQKHLVTYIIPPESFSETEGPEEPILEVESTVTEEFTKEPTIGTETIGTTSAILPDALISNMTVPRETNTGTEANEPLLETTTKEDPEHNNKGSDEQIPVKYGSGESLNYDLNRMITTDPTSLISTNGESVLQNDRATPEINTEETFSNVVAGKPDSRAMKKHSKSSHKHSEIIDKEDACNNVAQKESATTPKDTHMPSAIYYIIDKIKQCLTKILNVLHH
ncbi:mucin-2-like, partial [Bombus pascuorum]|uniref:mucin-2-like n=1 Tax=Bombus pascuorum TaxID=65598 RepID=UPI00298E07D7